ncbi:lipopolysaccharide biosynthesis protein [Acidaminococcus fermentans]|uniref:lipopolysaccharide biosynthesis protein n=1 Tax=Acidaminococcus fermentans TaxID=905 RepID=UPI002490E00C|nr:hypothetical protein [Acidaminococcus fermentans]
MRKILLLKNTFASLLSQITALVCGFILPRLFLEYYGSSVNGLINSITQFLGVISFLELGVGAVVQSSLYKPLAAQDNNQISRIAVSANRFFQRLARIFIVYVIALCGVYPYLVNREFSFLYTATLIISISISLIAQYYFGIVNALILNADQRGYIQYNAQTITILLNTIISFILISSGFSVQLVKLSTSCIFLLRPLILSTYVKQSYKINWRIQYSREPIQQKWNGVAQHIAAIILDTTDIIVLTIFSTLSNVSIYSVYFLIVKGVKTLFLSITNGIQSLIGELWAKKELNELSEVFSWTEWCIHTGTTFIFSCTAVLIVPFVQVYTAGIHDADYSQPLFALLLVGANAMHCLRLPYNIMVLAAGHYKQTQQNYINAALLNIIISVLAVKNWGLIGVAIGTLVAMSYQTLWLSWYDSNHFIRYPMKLVMKQFLVDGIIAVSTIAAGRFLAINDLNYISWILMAIQTTIITGILVLAINMIFYRGKMASLIKKVIRRLL